MLDAKLPPPGTNRFAAKFDVRTRQFFGRTTIAETLATEQQTETPVAVEATGGFSKTDYWLEETRKDLDRVFRRISLLARMSGWYAEHNQIGRSLQRAADHSFLLGLLTPAEKIQLENCPWA